MLPGMHQPGKDMASKDPIITIYLAYGEQWIGLIQYHLTNKAKKKVTGEVFISTQAKKELKIQTFIAVLLRDKKLQLIRMYNLLSLEKNGISKFCDSVTSLFLDVSDGGRLRIMPAFKRQW